MKQSPILWQDEVKKFLTLIGFSQCKIDLCIYVRSSEKDDTFTAVYVHVDDLAITGTDIARVKSEISNQWEMDDLGPAHTVVGIEITWLSDHKYSLCQSKLAETILNRCNMSHVKPAATPLSPGQKLYQSTGKELDAP